MKIAILFLSLSLTVPAFAEKGHDHSDMTPQQKAEMHEKMGEAHKKAAACLKSGKAEKDCHEELRKSMKEFMPEGMMEKGHHMMCDEMHEHGKKDSGKPGKGK